MSRSAVDMAGQFFGRLKVIERAQHGVGKVARWRCLCACGKETVAARGNLLIGNIRSCGCLAVDNRHAPKSKRERPTCTVDGCSKIAWEFSRTLCRMHGQRVRRYGDVTFTTPESIRASRQRKSLLSNLPTAKPDTYKKLFGRHEHRVLGEMIAGRKLRTDEHVHHKDGNKHNNAVDNLEILSASDHARLHQNGGRKNV